MASALIGGAIGFAVLMFLLLRKKPEVAVVAPLFTLPREATPFAVAALLHRIRNSDKITLSADQQSQLRNDIVALERTAFTVEANGPSENTATRDLESIARRWIDLVAATPAR